MQFILIVITYLGGNTWGPMVDMQQFETKQQCEAVASAVLAQVDEMSKSNAFAMGQTLNGKANNGRVIATARCKPM